MSRYFITGVAGFVGRYFVDYLRETEPEAEIFGADIVESCNLPINYQMFDLNDDKAVADLIGRLKPDYIVHLAAISSVGQSWQMPAECFKNNTGIMLNLLTAVKNCNLKSRILSIGSSEEYGQGDMPYTELSPLNPQNPYAVAKLGQEYIGRLYAQSLGCDVVMTRSFNHIGPRQSERFVVPSFMRQLVNISKGAENIMLVGNIEVARDFLDVRDVVDAYYKILHYGKSGEVYNVCSGKACKLRDIISTAEDILGIKANIRVDESRLRPNDVMLIVGDNGKLRTELDWKPNYDIKTTIRDIIEDMKR